MWVATENTAKAALRAARAAERAEEPRMLIEDQRILGMDISEGELSNIIEFRWLLRNYGRSPAWLDRIEVSAQPLQTLPQRAIYGNGQTLRHVIPERGSFEGRGPTVIEIPLSAKVNVHAGTANLFIWGRILYRDASQNRHESRFAFKLVNDDVVGGWTRLEPVGSDDFWSFT